MRKIYIKLLLIILIFLIFIALLVYFSNKGNKILKERFAIAQISELEQRHFVSAPFQGQISNFSEWLIPDNSFSSATNVIINEQGAVRSRPGFYCYLDSPDTSSRIYGAFEYKKRIEGGSNTEIIYLCGDTLYKNTGQLYSDNTDISGNIVFSTNSKPVFFKYYNNLFMANGEDNPIVYDQDGNCRYIAHATVTTTCRFTASSKTIDSNAIDFEDYYFRPSMTLTVTDATDANNNDDFEIADVDSNVITLLSTDVIVDENYNEVTLTGFSSPRDLTIRSPAEFDVDKTLVQPYWDYNVIVEGLWYSFEYEGFRSGMTIEVLDSDINDGTYTMATTGTQIGWTFSNGYSIEKSVTYLVITTNGFSPYYHKEGYPYEGGIVFGTWVETSTDIFTPTCLAGHKGRLFAGGVKQFPTKLYFTAQLPLWSYYYDIWRDRTGYNDGAGNYDIDDRINALIPEFYDNLVIFCENSIFYHRGDDPGFDILTPSQGLVFQLVPVSKNIGCVGPNAVCRANNDIYFWSEQGMMSLSALEQFGNYKVTTLSLPIDDIHARLVEYNVLSGIKMIFVPHLNAILIACGYNGVANDTVLYYNTISKAFSILEFATGKTPNTLFDAATIEIDANDTYYKAVSPYPKKTCWIGTNDGKLWAMNEYLCRDLDYSDVNNPVEHTITSEIITAKIKPIDEYLDKNMLRLIISARELINFSDAMYGSLTTWHKTDNGAWSDSTTLNFNTYSDANDSEIDYYELMPVYGIDSTGRAIQIKLSSSSKYGFELKSFMIEYIPTDYENLNIY